MSICGDSYVGYTIRSATRFGLRFRIHSSRHSHFAQSLKMRFSMEKTVNEIGQIGKKYKNNIELYKINIGKKTANEKS